MSTHIDPVAAVADASRRTPLRLASTLATWVAPLLAAIVLLGCAPLPPADASQAGGSATSERRPAHWETDGLPRSGNHGSRQR